MVSLALQLCFCARDKKKALGQPVASSTPEVKKKATKTQPVASSTPKVQPKTRRAKELQQEEWRMTKRRQRAKWGPQKWRRHREKSLAAYYDRRGT